jgi:hypothetical protein
VGDEVLAVQEPLIEVTATLKSPGCCTPAHLVPGGYVMAFPVHDALDDVYSTTEKEHDPPVAAPHVQSLHVRVSSTDV